MYEMGHNQEQFDLIRAFDYNPPHNFTKLREKNDPLNQEYKHSRISVDTLL